MELKKEKFVNDVYMSKDDFSKNIGDYKNADQRNYFISLAKQMQANDPQWLTPDRKAYFGL
ncbi:MAG: hypothetical protein ACRC4W_00100 [Treponemataceae bacterium]